MVQLGTGSDGHGATPTGEDGSTAAPSCNLLSSPCLCSAPDAVLIRDSKSNTGASLGTYNINGTDQKTVTWWTLYFTEFSVRKIVELGGKLKSTPAAVVEQYFESIPNSGHTTTRHPRWSNDSNSMHCFHLLSLVLKIFR